MGLHEIASILLKMAVFRWGKNVGGFLSGLRGWAKVFFMLHWDEFVKVNWVSWAKCELNVGFTHQTSGLVTTVQCKIPFSIIVISDWVIVAIFWFFFLNFLVMFLCHLCSQNVFLKVFTKALFIKVFQKCFPSTYTNFRWQEKNLGEHWSITNLQGTALWL